MTRDPRETERTRTRYQRIAPVYDAMETLAEKGYQSWRQRLWSLVQGPKVLEVGVGTGKNMPFYPKDVRTVENVRRSGLQVERVEDLGASGIFKLIVARPEAA